MFANFAQLISGRPLPDAGPRAFVEEVRVHRREPRNPRIERLIGWCWVLIAVKHVAVIWAVHHYAVPSDQLCINCPTFLLGLPATAAYCARP